MAGLDGATLGGTKEPDYALASLQTVKESADSIACCDGIRKWKRVTAS